MSIVQAKCTECGGALIVNNSNEEAKCQFCGNTFIVQEAIDNFNTYNPYNEAYDNITTHNYSDDIDVNVLADVSKEVVENAVCFADQQQKTSSLQYEEQVQYNLNEQKYNKAMALIDTDNPSQSDFENAAEILKSIENFKDANEKAVYFSEKAECMRKDNILQQGIDKEKSAPGGIEGKAFYEAAIEYYKAIPGWRDADERLAFCEAEIEKRNTSEKKKTNFNGILRIISILFGIFVIGAVIFGVYSFISSKPQKIFKEESKIILKSDGSVIATGEYGPGGEYNITDWEGIKEIAVSSYCVVGLREDKTVVVAGPGADEYDVTDWNDIIAISAGEYHIVGLQEDKTVVAVGENYDGECNVGDWTNIAAISAGDGHTVGLKSDGTVVSTCTYDDGGKYPINKWFDIKAISAGDGFVVGLKSHGEFIARGSNYYGQCNDEYWDDIVAISAGDKHTVGLKSNGNVVSVGDNEDGQRNIEEWTDIVYVYAGVDCTVGLKSDGTIVYAGKGVNYECYDYTDEDLVSIMIVG